jgi:nitric oxide synthase oxygenase domain/subunit
VCRYAGYREAGTCKVLGDPAEVDFTQMLVQKYGWQPPSPRGMFDVLPLLLQAHPDQQPQVCLNCKVVSTLRHARTLSSQGLKPMAYGSGLPYGVALCQYLAR